MRTVFGTMGKLGVHGLSTVNIGYFFFYNKTHFLLELTFFSFSFAVLFLIFYIHLIDGDAGTFLGMFT